MRFLFVYPDFLEATKLVKSIPGNYNEGIASISAVLRQGGHDTFLLHLTYMPTREDFIRQVKSFSPDMIGFSVRTSALGFVTEMAGWLDDAMGEVYVIAGGYHASLAPEEVITLRGIDAVCLGEGEFVTLDFVSSFEANGRPDLSADSFWIREGDTIHKNPVRPYLLDVDALPFPDLDIFDFPRLKSNATQNTAEVIVSRGCLYSCTYCANAQLRNLYPDKKHYTRFRSPENAIAYLERQLEKDPKIEAFNFNDAILNMYEDWFYAFTQLYMEKIGKKYTCNLRFDHMDEKMARRLADSGCYLVTIGLENGNEAFRRKYLRRTMDNDHIVEVSHMLRRFGVIVYTYNIIGLPHETLELSLETIRLNARMHTDNIVASNFFPYPATEIRRIAEEAGFIDPSVSPHDPMQLRQPNFKRSDFMYVKYSFLKLIKKYRKIYSRYQGEDQARRLGALDRRICGRHHPRKLIGAFRRRTHLAQVAIKRVASRRLPALYKKLRNLVIRRKAAAR